MEEFENNVQVQNENDKKKNNKKRIIIIAVIIIVLVLLTILGLLFFMVEQSKYNQSKVNNYGDKNEIKEQETNEQETQTTEKNDTVSDTDNNYSSDLIIQYSKDAIIEYINSNKTITKFGITNSYRYPYKLFKGELSESDKLLITLRNLEWEPITGDEWKSEPYISDWINSQISVLNGRGENTETLFKNNHQKKLEDVDKVSLKLFGKKLENIPSTIGKCPTYSYSDSVKMFFKQEASCGGTSGSDVATYIYNVETNDEVAYVYYSVAYIVPETDNKITIYKDIKMLTNDLDFPNIEYDGVVEEIAVEEGNYIFNKMREYKIDESNYNNFSKYKFSFKKNSDGEYYFVGSQQID